MVVPVVEIGLIDCMQSVPSASNATLFPAEGTRPGYVRLPELIKMLSPVLMFCQVPSLCLFNPSVALAVYANCSIATACAVDFWDNEMLNNKTKEKAENNLLKFLIAGFLSLNRVGFEIIP
jgi:hypothetical protein